MPNSSIVQAGIKEASKSKEEVRMSAVLYRGSCIIRSKHNNKKTIQYRKEFFGEIDPTRHAEINVLHRMPKDVTHKCSLLVIRMGKKNNLLNAKPCKACLQTILSHRIRKVYYSDYDGNIKKLNLRNIKLSEYKKDMVINVS